MARIWQLGVIPTRPGTYFRTSSGDVVVEGATNGIVALVYQSNWGPLNEVVDLGPEDLNNLSDYVGTGSGYEVARQALIGGAKVLRLVRAGGSGGAKAYRNFRAPDVTSKDAAGKTVTTRGANVVRLYAKYYGARTFYATLKTNLASGKKQVDLYDDGKLLESISFTLGGNEATKMVNAVNESSSYFTAKRYGTGSSKLKDVVQVKFSGGKNPITNVAVYSAALEVLERYKWNVVIADSDTAEVQDMLCTFVKQSYEVGRLGMTVLCGKHTASINDRTAYAASINDWRVVYMLSGWLGNDGKKYTTYLAAARLAGMIAECETNASLTHIVVQYALKPLENLTNGQITAAEEKGCLVLSINDSDQVWIDSAINTLITIGNDQDEGWKKIRRTKCRFELMDRINRTCDKLVGRLNNDAHGRATIITAMTTVIREMIGERKLFEGSYAAEDPVHKPIGDRAYFVLVIGDIDSMEKIFLDYHFSYANPFSELDTVETA